MCVQPQLPFIHPLVRPYSKAVQQTCIALLTASIGSLVQTTNQHAQKVVVKSIMTKEAALEALAHGVDAVWVSNHGGRQLDTVPATIEILPEVKVATGSSLDGEHM